ncbi:MAG: glycosyl hydrolase [Dehalococcoidia bacterium]
MLNFATDTQISRRNFLVTGGAAASAVTAAAFLGPQALNLTLDGPDPALAGAADKTWGIWQPGAPWDMGPLQPVPGLGARKPEAVHWYAKWSSSSFESCKHLFDRVSDFGAVPVLSWMPKDLSLKSIPAGDWDAYISSWATGLKNYGKPVYLRIGHEMNIPHHPWSVGVNGNTGSDFIRAWRRVVRTFRDRGANNVKFIWAPNIGWSGTTPFSECYPGNAYVDWIGLDGYNGGSALDWGGWQSFEKIFLPSYQLLVGKGKPMAVTEVGSVEQGGNKAKWITDMFAAMRNKMPAFKMLLWFNEHGSGDWRITTSSSASEAFRKGVAGW